ncbi:MAG TPA: hypothetical protein VIU87_08745 [Mycobacterium sp.]
MIRRSPTGPIPIPADDTRTGIIRRAPTGPFPAAPHGPLPAAPPDEPATTAIPRPPRSAPVTPPGGTTAIAACVIAMLSGWPTSVVATDLIAGWWDTDRLFCAAVGFLALVFAAGTISGVVLLLLRRNVGRYLIAAGALVALLAFGGVFIAGADIPWIVYTMPVLPVASAVLALLPATRRWATAG